MENAIKAILISVAVLITGAVASLLLFIASNGNSYSAKSTKNLVQLETMVSEYNFKMFDATLVSGDFIRTVALEYQEKIPIRVVTTLAPKGFTKIRTELPSSDFEYVNPDAEFRSELIRDKNETILEIRFVQEGAHYIGND